MKKWIGLALVAGLLVGCDDISMHVGGGPQIVGSGNVTTLTRKLGSFKSVTLDGSMDVEVKIGKQTEAQVKGDDNLVALVKTEIKGDTLHIYTDQNDQTKKGIKVFVTTPSIDGASLAGSGDLSLNQVTANSLDLSITGSGNLKASGSAKQLDAIVTGSGSLGLFDLKADRAKAKVSGSGDIQVDVTDSLDASITGSGEIRYKGHPQVSKSVTGSGNIGPTN